MFFEADENAEEFDQSFADDLKAAGNVFLPMLFQAEPAAISPEAQPRATVTVESSDARQASDTHAGVKLPIPVLAQQARGLGVINLSADADGPTRRVPLLGQVNGNVVPHLSLAVAQYLLGADRFPATEAETDANGQQVIMGKVSRQDLAKTIGASREMVSRVMKDLETRGFIETLPSGAMILKNRLSTLS